MFDDHDQYWYNLTTGEVEFGRLSPGVDRVGPFDSQADAARAPEILRERARAWAEEEAEEDAWGSEQEERGE